VINKTLPLALICAFLFVGCSSVPSKADKADSAAGEQATLQQQLWQEQQKTTAFLNNYQPGLQLISNEQGLKLERRDEHWVVSIPVDDYFNVNRQANTLLPASLPRISQLVKLLQDDPEAGVLIIGHLDGELASQDSALSSQQAQAIAAIFRLGGFGRERLLFKGMGGEMPRAANDSAEGRKQNRRVELLVTRQSTLPHILRHYSQPIAAVQKP